jgi:hypothetical protein
LTFTPLVKKNLETRLKKYLSYLLTHWNYCSSEKTANKGMSENFLNVLSNDEKNMAQWLCFAYMCVCEINTRAILQFLYHSRSITFTWQVQK